MSEVKIRVASVSDAEQNLKIYEEYVKNTAISFEYEVPTLEEFQGRMRKTLMKHPYLVAEVDGRIVGYAYTSVFKERAAYDWNVETTIYLDKNQKGKGIGKKLYQALEDVCKAQNVLNMNACIGYPKVEDEYLTKNSADFHAHIGYKLVGEFHNCGYKFDRWYDMIWMEKLIGEHTEHPKAVIPFPELEKEVFEKLNIQR